MSHSTLDDLLRASAPPSTQHVVHPVSLWAAALAEGIGTFGLVFAGCGAIMIDAESHGQITHVGVGLVFGLIITVMIYAFGHISGAHFNPAVTLAFVMARHFPWRRLWVYWSAQLVGAVQTEVAKRIDVVGTALFQDLTMEALSDLDLSYTPPLGSPWDIVQMGAQAWSALASSPSGRN